MKLVTAYLLEVYLNVTIYISEENYLGHRRSWEV